MRDTWMEVQRGTGVLKAPPAVTEILAPLDDGAQRPDEPNGGLNEIAAAERGRHSLGDKLALCPGDEAGPTRGRVLSAPPLGPILHSKVC